MTINIKHFSICIICCFLCIAARSQYVNLTNHWTAENIIVDNGALSLSKTSSNGWVIEKTTEEKYVRIKNAVTGTYLHTQNGPLEAGQISTGWYSAEWTLIPVGPYMQIVNRWRKTYINNEHGKLEATPLGKPGWLSAQWILAPTKSTLVVTSGGPAPTDNSVGGKLVGTWLAYDDIGRAYSTPCKIYYSGTTLTIDNGQGSKSTLLAAPGLVKASDWGKVGTPYNDGSAIDWQNGQSSDAGAEIAIGTSLNLLWVKNSSGKPKAGDVLTTVHIPLLSGTWTEYNFKDVKQPNKITITQHLYKIKFKSDSQFYGVADMTIDQWGIDLKTPFNTTLGVYESHVAGVTDNDKKISWDDGRYWVKD